MRQDNGRPGLQPRPPTYPAERPPFVEDFAAFYTREFPRIVAIAAAVGGSRTIAEDLAQEAMIRAHRDWEKVSSYDKPGAWVRRVAVNLSISASRRAALHARKLLGLGTAGSLPAGPQPEDEAVWDAVRKLPGNQRAAVALHYLEDRPIDEIARILGCAEATARVHLHRGRLALAKTLDPEGHR